MGTFLQKPFILLVVLAVCLGVQAPRASSAPIAPVVVGNDAIDRGEADLFSDIGLVFLDEVFPSGTITSWQVFVKRIDNAQGGVDPRVGLMVLEDQGSGVFRIDGLDIRSVNLGLNTFGSTSIAVEDDEVLGLFIATAKVAFDTVSGDLDTKLLNTSFLTVDPSIGQAFVAVGSLRRDYSINATVQPVPLPPALPLTAAVMIFGGYIARRQRRRGQVQTA